MSPNQLSEPKHPAYIGLITVISLGPIIANGGPIHVVLPFSWQVLLLEHQKCVPSGQGVDVARSSRFHQSV